MERFRLSMLPSAITLIVSNLFPLVFVFPDNLHLGSLLFLYWLETWIIGFYTVLKIRKARAEVTEKEKQLFAKQLFQRFFPQVSRSSIVLLFSLQYTVIILFYGLLLFGFLTPFFLSPKGSFWMQVVSIFPKDGIAVFAPLLLMFFVSHGISYITNFIGKREFETTSPVYQMLKPYDRVIAMHVFVIAGAISLTGLKNIGFNPIDVKFTTYAAILIKIIADIAAHMKEHLIEKAEGVGDINIPEKVRVSDGKPYIWIKRAYAFLIFIFCGVVLTIALEIALQKAGLWQKESPISADNRIVPARQADRKITNELDVLFVSGGYTDFSLFRQHVEKFKNRLLSQEPYSEFASLFRFHTLETAARFDCQDLTENDKAYVGGKFVRQCCDGTKILQSVKASHIPFNRIVVLIYDAKLFGRNAINGYTIIGSGGIPDDENIVLVNTSREGSEKEFIHELSHTFGVEDEYLLYDTPGPVENKCENNCCQSSSACVEWKDIPGASCIQGCKYPNWYRSSEDSIMRNATIQQFSPAARDLIKRRLLRYYKPELVAGSISYAWSKPHLDSSPQIKEGEKLAVSIQAWNRGAATASASVMSGRIDLNSDHTWDINLPAANVVALGPDMTQMRTFNYIWKVPAGKHLIEACMDVTNTVDEADEKNNCETYHLTIIKK